LRAQARNRHTGVDRIEMSRMLPVWIIKLDVKAGTTVIAISKRSIRPAENRRQEKNLSNC
jgi:hypothetical protein